MENILVNSAKVMLFLLLPQQVGQFEPDCAQTVLRILFRLLLCQDATPGMTLLVVEVEQSKVQK